MTPVRLAELLAQILAELSGAGQCPGEPPTPCGSWEREARYASAIALLRSSGAPLGSFGRCGPAEVAEQIAVRLRGRDGVSAVRVRPDGILVIAVTCPGEIVREIVRPPASAASPWSARLPAVAEPGQAAPDFPRTWENPGFVVRYAHARAAAVLRWAADLGVPRADFRPQALDDPYDRAVLRLLAELPSRAVSRAPAWAAYAERLALAYHDAHEHAPATPKGDEPVRAVHTARLWLAAAVRSVLSRVLATPLPERL